jgi:hypothetical protein
VAEDSQQCGAGWLGGRPNAHYRWRQRRGAFDTRSAPTLPAMPGGSNMIYPKERTGNVDEQ